jgi:hypothetical protein
LRSIVTPEKTYEEDNEDRSNRNLGQSSDPHLQPNIQTSGMCLHSRALVNRVSGDYDGFFKKGSASCLNFCFSAFFPLLRSRRTSEIRKDNVHAQVISETEDASHRCVPGRSLLLGRIYFRMPGATELRPSISNDHLCYPQHMGGWYEL